MEERYNCVFCLSRGKTPDTKGKLYVNRQKGVYHCFRCGASGRITKDFLSKLGPPLKQYSSSNLSTDDLNQFLRSLVVVEKDELKLISEEAFAFVLRKRLNFQKFYVKYYPWGVGLVFLFKEGDKVVGYQVRTFPEFECGVPKYLTGKGFKKSEFLYNLENVRGNLVVVVEGIFDTFVLPEVSVAMLGSSLTDIQLRKLSRFKQIILANDSDAIECSVRMCKTLIDKGFDVGILALPHGSPGDFSREELVDMPCFFKAKGDCEVNVYPLGYVIEKYSSQGGRNGLT